MSAYIDTSALAKCYVREARSLEVVDWLDEREVVHTSPLTLVEFRCLLARRRRAGQIDSALEANALARFDQDVLDRVWRIAADAPHLLQEARLLIDMLPAVPLRALDAIHLAHARRNGTSEFATANKTQAEAARDLGMNVFIFC